MNCTNNIIGLICSVNHIKSVEESVLNTMRMCGTKFQKRFVRGIIKQYGIDIIEDITDEDINFNSELGDCIPISRSQYFKTKITYGNKFEYILELKR